MHHVLANSQRNPKTSMNNVICITMLSLSMHISFYRHRLTLNFNFSSQCFDTVTILTAISIMWHSNQFKKQLGFNLHVKFLMSFDNLQTCRWWIILPETFRMINHFFNFFFLRCHNQKVEPLSWVTMSLQMT